MTVYAAMPSVYELAQLAMRLRQAELEHWQTAIVPAQRRLDRVRGDLLVIPAPYHIWATKPNGRPQYPAIGIRPWLQPWINQLCWCVDCYLNGCGTPTTVCTRPDFASAVLAAVQHLEANGMSPGPRLPQRGLARDEKAKAAARPR